MTFDHRIKLQLGDLVYANLLLGQQVDEARAELAKAKEKITELEKLSVSNEQSEQSRPAEG